MHRLKVGVGVAAAASPSSLPVVILLLLAVPSAAAASVGSWRPGAAVTLLRCWPGRRLHDGLAAGRGPAALGAAVRVAGHLSHLDEAAVEARQVLQGAVVLHPPV